MAFDLMYEAMKRAVESEEFSGLGLKIASHNLVYCKHYSCPLRFDLSNS